MREIKFRGKRSYSKEWVYGWYYEYNHKSIISSEDHSDGADSYYNDEVDPKTVGQFIMDDKKGKETYEGDVVTDGHSIGFVFYDHDSSSFLVDFGYNDDAQEMKAKLPWHEVIGNIHEEQYKHLIK